MKGTAQKDNGALELPALGQAGHRLVHHRLKDGGGHVLLAPALVEDGLDVAFGKDPAPGGDGVNFFMPQGQFVQLIHGYVQQSGHLVDEGPGAPGAGAVHPLLQGIAEENDFGVLSPQLNHGVGTGNELPYRGGGGVNLLDKIQARGLGHAKSRGAGNEQLNLLSPQKAPESPQGLTGAGFGIVTLIGAEEQFILCIQHHDLNGGGADVDSDTQCHDLTSKWNVRLQPLFIYI